MYITLFFLIHHSIFSHLHFNFVFLFSIEINIFLKSEYYQSVYCLLTFEIKLWPSQKISL